jgi:uncharacterized protein
MVRGVAILGILLMNIPGFGFHNAGFLGVLQSPPADPDHRALSVIFTFFDGTMRGLFSMLFGAGMLLFVMNKQEKDGGATVTEYYFRRLAWLVGFGLLHAYVFQWEGEILFYYGLMGMILFPFRNASPKWLWALGILALLLNVYKQSNNYNEQRDVRLNYTAAVQAQKEKKQLTPEQEEALGAWPQMEKNFVVDSARMKDAVAQMRGSYGDVFMHQLPMTAQIEVFLTYHNLWDLLCMMFIGMALLKMGFFSNKWRTSSYVLTLLLGYGLGVPIGYQFFHGLELMVKDMGSYLDHYSMNHQQLYDIRRVLLCLGHVSLIMLIYRSGWLNWLMKALASVGQMAFTNYFMQTIICTLFFFGYGLGYYNKLRFHQLYYVVFAIWILQLIVSPIWLRYFKFGPFEWAWRSLTYWKKQPFRSV